MADRTVALRLPDSDVRAHARGREAHPTLALPLEAFSEHARRCARSRLARRGEEPTAAALGEAVAACEAPDLYLAAAAVTRVPGSWERLQAEHAERLVALARSRGAGAAEADQQVAELWSDLAVARSDAGGAPPLAQYDGSGRLFAWLGTCLLRRIATRARSAGSQKTVPYAASQPAFRAGDDPVAAAEHRELEAALGSAVRRGVTGLTPQERAALVLSHRDGWSGKEVARLLGVGEPRVSRLKARATEKVRDAILPVLESQGGRGSEEGSWAALRDSVAVALAGVAIPARDSRPLPKDPLVRRPGDG